MLKKLIGIFICTLMIFTTCVPLLVVHNVIGNINKLISVDMKDLGGSSSSGWTLQWNHAYSGMGHSQLAQPVGDLDGDGINEVIVGGYENSGMCRILSYDAVQETYIEEYSWYIPGSSYHIPTGACILDLNDDDILELCVAWGFTDADGLYAYTWDGTILTMLDRYYGIGVDFLYDCYYCDYNDDGIIEVLIANAPYYGGHTQHVTALGWDITNQKFYYETSWSCPGGALMECPMVWSGDVDNDGKTEVIADISTSSTTKGTWALNWNTDTESWDDVPVWTNYGGATVYGDGIADINSDGIPEIGIGSYGGTPQGWLFQWDGSTYQQVWNGQYPNGQPVIESVALGDADNDGHNEFCFGTQQVHIIGWNGRGYYEEATLIDSQSMLAGMNICDFDTDGKNELKACEIMSGTGSEFIWKYVSPDSTPPVTTFTLVGETDGPEYISNVTVTLNATDTDSGVDFTMYKLDDAMWTSYSAPFIVYNNGLHIVLFYSVDKEGNTEVTKNTTFIISHHNLLQISVKGGIGIIVTIKNTANTDQTMVPWNITLLGGYIIVGGKEDSGTIPLLKTGAEITLKLIVVGFGKTSIVVTAGNLEQHMTGWMLLLFVIGVK